MKEKIKKYFGELLTIIGTGIFISSFFNFSYMTRKGLCLPLVGCENITGVVYYYSKDAILLLTIGGVLIVAGILIMKNRNK